MFGIEKNIRETKELFRKVEQSTDVRKVAKVIISCTKPVHLPAAAKMVNLFEKKHGVCLPLIDMYYCKTTELI